MAKSKVQKIYSNLKYSAERMSKLHKAIKDDFKYVQGKQWDEQDVDTLRKQGVKALTINKLKPIIKLITGIERQSRSDYKIFPEGGEDNLVSDIITRLTKNVTKMSKLQDKQSLQFKNGCTGGMCFIEPYISYDNNILTGELKFKKINNDDVFLDPDGKEYDLSDHRFNIKLTRKLTKDDLLMLFPEQESKINNLPSERIDLSRIGTLDNHIQGLDYPALSQGTTVEDTKEEPLYDLIDHYEKVMVKRYFVADPERGILKKVGSKNEAEELSTQLPGTQIIARNVIEVHLTQIVGEEILFEGPSWALPTWNEYLLIPFFAELVTEELDDLSLNIQGIVRGIKDLQEEYNKRRTQELRHLNASANSGFDIEEGQYSAEEEDKLKRFGSSPGVVAKRKKNTPPLNRITPMPLSQGHSQLAAEHSFDLKEASGVQPDLLVSDSRSQSGRAILFKQRQGMVMIQEMIDNFNKTKKITGQFIVSQLKEVFTVETALETLGDRFVAENFTVPVTSIIERGLSKIAEGRENEVTELEKALMIQYPNNGPQNPVVDENNKLVTTVDYDTAILTINELLNDVDIMKYDIAVGEGPFNETIRMANFMDLKELAQQGVPIPPATLIDASMLPESEKNKISQQLAAEQQALAQRGQAELQMEDKHHSEEIKIDQQEVDIKRFEAEIKAMKVRLDALQSQNQGE
jgi:hypothetical protein